MKQQVWYVHGGSGYSNYEDFLEDLQSMTVDPRAESFTFFKHTLKEDLGDMYEVFLPVMPNKMNAKYEEWRIWFEKYVPYMTNGAVLVGHSLGAMFLARYLSEHALPVRIAKLILLAGACEKDKNEGEDEEKFYVQTSEGFDALNDSAQEIYIMHSTDDPVVPYRHAELFAEQLPRATLVSFIDRGHFLQPEFPELINIINKKG